jgi:hypothetical protein
MRLARRQRIVQHAEVGRSRLKLADSAPWRFVGVEAIAWIVSADTP